MKHRKMKGSDKETTITAEEYAQILKNAAETAQVAEQTGSKWDLRNNRLREEVPLDLFYL
jgi:hypothetical protein